MEDRFGVRVGKTPNHVVLSVMHIADGVKLHFPRSGKGLAQPFKILRSNVRGIRLFAELIEQRFGLDEVGGVEAFGEPVVDFREHRARFFAAIGTVQHSRERGRRAQFE
jgi:hypothetical protein